MRERPIVSVPNLRATLESLEPGDCVRLGEIWSYGNVRSTANLIGLTGYRTAISGEGITFHLLDKLP